MLILNQGTSTVYIHHYREAYILCKYVMAVALIICKEFILLYSLTLKAYIVQLSCLSYSTMSTIEYNASSSITQYKLYNEVQGFSF